MPMRETKDQPSQEDRPDLSRPTVGNKPLSSSAQSTPSPVNQDHAVDDNEEPLMDLEIKGSGRELSSAALQLLSEGRSRFRTVDVFDFVPCNYEMFWDFLDAQPRGRFCEYGSGFGIATGLAELLGFEALGIELSPDLVTASHDLLTSQGLKSRIEQGDYLKRRDMADIYFTYAWPSHMHLVEQHFSEIAQPHAKLLYCHGQDDIRCKVLRPS
ncbi:hypothetical protein [Aureliella helgolandensis]|uniref:Methyltransferase domain protein n=1 Tax=Aureliella helgolandensis TaxID=2527968 RepID=A0A518FZX8_9BACT|nr:hypothetical protein [Aureliella helgolandensis]QDV21917.1 hypothetical protein Q31a_01960 [Aureliella helgolandensis]